MKIFINCNHELSMWDADIAKETFFEGMMVCDGSEKERYSNIFCGIVNGEKYINDGSDIVYFLDKNLTFDMLSEVELDDMIDAYEFDGEIYKKFIAQFLRA